MSIVVWPSVKAGPTPHSLIITKDGALGIEANGLVVVKTFEAWHALADKKESARGRVSATERLHNLCDALSEHADESPFTREEWNRVDKEIVRLQNENRALRSLVEEVYNSAKNPSTFGKWDKRAAFALGLIDPANDDLENYCQCEWTGEGIYKRIVKWSPACCYHTEEIVAEHAYRAVPKAVCTCGQGDKSPKLHFSGCPVSLLYDPPGSESTGTDADYGGDGLGIHRDNL